jgi:hypothetical protein
MQMGASRANKMQTIVIIAGASLLLTIMSIIWASNAAWAGRYCLGTREYHNCGFSTWHQCQAARHGQSGVCYRKPGT